MELTRSSAQRYLPRQIPNQGSTAAVNPNRLGEKETGGKEMGGKDGWRETDRSIDGRSSPSSERSYSSSEQLSASERFSSSDRSYSSDRSASSDRSSLSRSPRPPLNTSSSQYGRGSAVERDVIRSIETKETKETRRQMIVSPRQTNNRLRSGSMYGNVDKDDNPIERMCARPLTKDELIIAMYTVPRNFQGEIVVYFSRPYFVEPNPDDNWHFVSAYLVFPSKFNQNYVIYPQGDEYNPKTKSFRPLKPRVRDFETLQDALDYLSHRTVTQAEPIVEYQAYRRRTQCLGIDPEYALRKTIINVNNTIRSLDQFNSTYKVEDVQWPPAEWIGIIGEYLYNISAKLNIRSPALRRYLDRDYSYSNVRSMIREINRQIRNCLLNNV